MSDARHHGIQRLGDMVDNSINRGVEKRYEAPVLEGDPQLKTWYRIPIPEGMSGDGSEYHIYMKKGTSDHLCIFLSGGGIAWNAYTAARPVTVGARAAGLPNYYWNNLRPLTQIMNIDSGLMEADNPYNPLNDWNYIVITYATGDLHVGDHDFVYPDENGQEQVLHFHGLKNFRASMERCISFFKNPDQILIAGDSAGAFAVPAVTPFVLEEYYPECENVTLFSDSGQLIYRKWKATARDVWRAPEAIWSAVQSTNITVDWYRRVYRIWGDRLRYLYAGSTRDYLLSAYYNDVTAHKYKTNHHVQEKYYQQMQEMMTQLKQITPKFGIFVYDWPNLRPPMTGTVHTAVRHMRYYFQTHGGLTMAEWLGDAVRGNVYDVNMDSLIKGV